MIYFSRFINVLYTILIFIFKMCLFCLLGIMLSLQMITIFFLFPIFLFLQLIEYIIVPLNYYIITGKNYYTNYKCILYVFCDFIETAKINFRKDKEYPSVEGFYEGLYKAICDINVLSKLNF